MDSYAGNLAHRRSQVQSCSGCSASSGQPGSKGKTKLVFYIFSAAVSVALNDLDDPPVLLAIFILSGTYWQLEGTSRIRPTSISTKHVRVRGI